MKEVQAPLEEVVLDPAGQPLRFRYAGGWQQVCEQLDAWRFGGRWWLGEAPRDCYLVQTGALVAELHYEYCTDAPGGQWWLARVLD